MKRLLFFLTALLTTIPTLAAEELPVLWLEAGRTNEFQTVYDGPEVDWSLKFGHRTLDSGKAPLSSMAQALGHRVLSIKTPPLKAGVQLNATLDFGSAPYRRVVIASPDPFEDRDAWFEQHPIALYDPEETTADLFEQNDIPFKRLRSFAEIEAVDNAVIVLGRGVDFEQERGLAALLFGKAVKGASVLVAAPKGAVPLDYHPTIYSLELRADAKKLFPSASGRRGGTGWALRAQNDQLVLATEFIPPYGSDGGKVMGVGPTILDIRFSDDRAIADDVQAKGRIIFDKELNLSRWAIGGQHVETRYYFKALIEQLSEQKGE